MQLEPKIRQQFLIHICMNEPLVSASLKTYLGLAGFSVQLTEDLESCLSHIQKNPAHIVIMSLSSTTRLNDWIEPLIKINNEIQFLLIGPSILISRIESYRPYGLIGLIESLDGFESHVLIQIEQACSELYFKYQNEQLLDQIEDIKSKKESEVLQLKAELDKLEKLSQDISNTFKKDLDLEKEANNKLKFELTQVQSQNEELIWLSRAIDKNLEYSILVEAKDSIASLIVHLEKNFSHSKWDFYYFKYVSEIQSFLMTQTRVINPSFTSQGANFRPSGFVLKDFMTQIEEGFIPQDFELFLKQILDIKIIKIYPLKLGNQIEGLLVFNLLENEKEVVTRRLDLEINYFKHIYFNRRLSQSLVIQSKDIDPVSQFEMNQSYFERLNAEYARARRLDHPVSILKVGIDNYEEIINIYSKPIMDQIISQLAQIIRKSSRINDSAFRVSEKEFSLILAHTPIKGALVRAERLRRLVEMYEFVGYPPGHLTVSCGLSEYPSLAESLEDLEKSSYQALEYIQKKSPNKVCLYSPERSN